MDETPEVREKRLDDAYEKVKTELAEEREVFGKAAETYEAMYVSCQEDFHKADLSERMRPPTAGEFMLAAQSASAMAEIHRLAERMTIELEHLYSLNHTALKNSLRIERILPNEVKKNLDSAISDYEAHIGHKGLTEEQDAMLKFFWEYFLGDKK